MLHISVALPRFVLAYVRRAVIILLLQAELPTTKVALAFLPTIMVNMRKFFHRRYTASRYYSTGPSTMNYSAASRTRLFAATSPSV